MTLFQELGKTGMTVVLVTHEPDIAQYATRVIVVRDGKIRKDERQAPRDAATELAALPPPEVFVDQVGDPVTDPNASALP